MTRQVQSNEERARQYERDAVMSSGFMSRDDRKAYLAAVQREARAIRQGRR